MKPLSRFVLYLTIRSVGALYIDYAGVEIDVEADTQDFNASEPEKLDDDENLFVTSVYEGNPKIDTVLTEYLELLNNGDGRRLKEIEMPEGLLISNTGKAVVDIRGIEPNNEAIRQAIEESGGAVTGCYRLSEGTCSAIVNLHDLPTMASHSMIASISSNVVESNVGLIDSEATRSMLVDEARSLFGFDGTGTKVCVLSTTFDCAGVDITRNTNATQDILLGDLPPLDRMDIIRDIGPDDPPFASPACNDEGRAMMQLIHDVAPGADLGFDTALLGLSAFADSIVEMVNRDCDIIVDDIIYFAETMYQDDLVAQAVDFATESGVAYFSSAGNSARGSWEEKWVEGELGERKERIKETFGIEFLSTLDFTDGQGEPRQYLRFTTVSTTTIVLQWEDPSTISPGLPGPITDLDMIVFRANSLSIVDASGNGFGLGKPFEICTVRPGSYDIVIGRYAGPVPGTVKLFFTRTVRRLNGYTWTISSATSYGHANAAGAMSVAAAAYVNTPPFGVDPARPESFTSAGGIPIIFDRNAERLSVPHVRGNPAFTAPDRTCTNFFGTLDFLTLAILIALILLVHPPLRPMLPQ